MRPATPGVEVYEVTASKPIQVTNSVPFPSPMVLTRPLEIGLGSSLGPS